MHSVKDSSRAAKMEAANIKGAPTHIYKKKSVAAESAKAVRYNKGKGGVWMLAGERLALESQ